MENERRNHNILLTVIGALTLLVAMVGATFAYFSATSSVEQRNIKTGELKINATSGAITQSNLIPTEFDSESESVSKTELDKNTNVAQLPITVNSTGTTIDAYYSFYLTTTGLETLLDKEDNGIAGDINWELIKDDGNESTYTKIEGGTFGGDMNNHRLNQNAQTITASNGKEEKYILLIWIKETGETQDNLQELTISATVQVEANQDASKLPTGE